MKLDWIKMSLFAIVSLITKNEERNARSSSGKANVFVSEYAACIKSMPLVRIQMECIEMYILGLEGNMFPFSGTFEFVLIFRLYSANRSSHFLFAIFPEEDLRLARFITHSFLKSWRRCWISFDAPQEFFCGASLRASGKVHELWNLPHSDDEHVVQKWRTETLDRPWALLCWKIEK